MLIRSNWIPIVKLRPKALVTGSGAVSTSNRSGVLQFGKLKFGTTKVYIFIFDVQLSGTNTYGPAMPELKI